MEHRAPRGQGATGLLCDLPAIRRRGLKAVGITAWTICEDDPRWFIVGPVIIFDPPQAAQSTSACCSDPPKSMAKLIALRRRGRTIHADAIPATATGAKDSDRQPSRRRDSRLTPALAKRRLRAIQSRIQVVGVRPRL